LTLKNRCDVAALCRCDVKSPSGRKTFAVMPCPPSVVILTPPCRHTRESGYLFEWQQYRKKWTPAFAGVTEGAGVTK